MAGVGGRSRGDDTGERVTRSEVMAIFRVKGNKTLTRETVVATLRVENRIKRYLGANKSQMV